MKLYYAHHVWKYDTPMENFEIQCIERQFKDAVIVKATPHKTDAPRKELR